MGTLNSRTRFQTGFDESRAVGKAFSCGNDGFSNGSRFIRLTGQKSLTMANDPATTEDNAEEQPQDTMSPAKRKRLQDCFERANELAGQSNFDYAHQLYAQAVANDPGNLVYVDAMLANLQKKYKNNKKGSRFSFGGRKAFKEAVAEEDWEEILREGLELLKNNPWDTQALREMARACAFNRFNEVELRYLKNALDGKPKDVEVNKHCAQSLARNGQFDMAISCWARVDEKTRTDEAQRMMSELTLAKTMGKPASIEAIGAAGERPVSPMPLTAPPEEDSDAESAATTEDASGDDISVASDGADEPQIKLNSRQTLEKAIDESPTDVDNYLQLAELHTKERRYGDAEKVLAKAIEAIGPSLKLESSHEDAQIRSAKARVAIAEQRAAGQKTEESKELVGKLRDELNRLELDIYQKRCKRYPDRLRYRYDLALRLRRAGNYLEAIKSYDEARKDPNCLVAATLEMGECWQQLKQYSKAMKCYEAAIEKSTELDGDRQKLSLYRGAVLAAALKKPEDAKGWLKELLKLDPDFKDAAARLDKLG